MHPKNISIADYQYDLPQHRIALYPLPERDQSKLLVFQGNVSHHIFRELPSLLRPGDQLFFNNTKVFPARFLAKTMAGANIEVFAIHPLLGDLSQAMTQTHQTTWACLVGNAKKWQANETLYLSMGQLQLALKMLHRKEGYSQIQFQWQPEQWNFADVCDAMGHVPLPPYIKRKWEQTDRLRYQTVYASAKGSVAAPTAGLHFTPQVMDEIERLGICRQELTLHVSAGTFKPVKSEQIANHEMHSEEIHVPLKVIEQLAKSGRKIAVGTTSMRSLESIYWFGKAVMEGRKKLSDKMLCGQWEPYELTADKNANQVFSYLLEQMQSQKLSDLNGHTKIIIAPGYPFQVVDGLITNFHQPGSTLILLVAAFVGEAWRYIYENALNNNYRFLSYGDSSLLWGKKQNASI